MLEAEQARLKQEIESFQKEKDELEFILNTHRTHCGPSTVGSAATVSSVSVNVGVNRLSVSVTSADTGSHGRFMGAGNLSTIAEAALVVSSSTVDGNVEAGMRQVTSVPPPPPPPVTMSASHADSVGCRPTSLPMLSPARTAGFTTSTSGMSLLPVGLESLADGHTGLTPLTGIPSGSVIVVGMPLPSSSVSSSDGSSVVRLL